MPRNAADLIRATERARLSALVSADTDVASPLHADDFQLITPAGTTVTKEQYLGDIASGRLQYLVWEPDTEIAVRFYGKAAVIRYRSRLDVYLTANHEPREVGKPGILRTYWHTDAYEQRGGRWQVVWSQATEIRGTQDLTLDRLQGE